MKNRALALGLLPFVLSCGPESGTTGDTSGSSSSSSSGSATSGTISSGATSSGTTSAATMTTAVADTSGTSNDTDSGSETSQEGDPCLEFEVGLFMPCPEGCVGMFIGELLDAETCEWDPAGGICVAEGGPRGPDEYLAYWIELDGQIYGTATLAGCLAESTKPAMLNQCTGGPGDHALCHCMGVDVTTMQECALPTDCPEVFTYDPASYPGADCALLALRDRTPAELSFFGGGEFAGTRQRLFVHADGTVTVSTQQHSDTSCFDAASPTMRCTLESPQYFDDCLGITDETDKAACLEPSNWQLECTPEPAACE